MLKKLSSASRLREKRHAQERAKTSKQSHPVHAPRGRGRASTRLSRVRSIPQLCGVKGDSEMPNCDALLNASFRRDCVWKGTRSTISISGIKKNGMKGSGS